MARRRNQGQAARDGQSPVAVKTLSDAVRELLNYNPNGDIWLDKESGMYEEGDEYAPFFSETFLYNLVGKDSARSILGLVRQIKELLPPLEYGAPEQDEVWP